MSTHSNIEWTDTTWNPTVGCTWASKGCDHCYAAAMTRRLEAMGKPDYVGLTTPKHFNGTVRTLEHRLDEPLRWKKPRRIFVNSMSDLFHKDVPFEFIDRVFAVMALCPQHTFQILTKRPERMAEYFAGTEGGRARTQAIFINADSPGSTPWPGWPLPNVWLGTSIENQEAADARIPHLLRTPAAVRFLSVEPLLGAISFRLPHGQVEYGDGSTKPAVFDCLRVSPDSPNPNERHYGHPGIHWVIVGCESLAGKRIARVEGYEDNARSVIEQCAAAGVPCYHKQMPIGGRACGDMVRFPELLRVREFPQAEMEHVHG